MRPTPARPALTLRLGALLFICAAAALLPAGEARAADPPVIVAHLRGAVDPVSARYLRRAVETAERERAAALVIAIDTPGGLDASMRQMVQDLLGSPVPTIAFVAPAGARAASAGVFVAQAASLVAMAPGTTIGAAHPVDSGGGDLGGDLRDKITNDAAAYIAALARRYGRNDAWVQDAVRRSVALDAEGALAQRVADLVVPDLPALLRAADGRVVTTAAGPVTLRVAGAPMEDLGMHPVEQIVQRLVDPTIAYLLLTVGFWAILIELFHPGALVPGITGAICLILAFVAFAALPVNWGGVLLILGAVALFVVDVKAATHGALTAAGLACFVTGSLLLYSPPGPRSPTLPAAAVPLPVTLAVSAVAALLAALVVGAAVRVARQPALADAATLAGAIGLASSALTPDGVVSVGGQLWSARLSDGTLAAGEPVRVLRRTGLTLEVEPAAPGGADIAQEAPLWPPVPS